MRHKLYTASGSIVPPPQQKTVRARLVVNTWPPHYGPRRITTLEESNEWPSTDYASTLTSSHVITLTWMSDVPTVSSNSSSTASNGKWTVHEDMRHICSGWRYQLSGRQVWETSGCMLSNAILTKKKSEGWKRTGIFGRFIICTIRISLFVVYPIPRR